MTMGGNVALVAQLFLIVDMQSTQYRLILKKIIS